MTKEKQHLLKIINASETKDINYRSSMQMGHYTFQVANKKSIPTFVIESMSTNELQRMLHGLLDDMIYDCMKMQRDLLSGKQT